MQWLESPLTTRDEERLSREIIDITQGAGTEVLDRRAPSLYLKPQLLRPSAVTCVRRRALLADHTTGLESLEGLELVDYSPLDDDWQENWKRYFRPTQVSQRFLVRPPWEQADDAQPGRIELIIEPGMAFGTGTHETTRLCLQTLDNPRSDYSTVLDVGCGSGILSVAVAKLGAQEVTGIDVDPAALVATQENADRNRVGHFVSTSTATLSDVEGEWPLVIANILSSILISIREPLCARVATGGQLLLSGILVSEQDDVCDAFTALGLRCVDVHVPVVCRCRTSL